MQDLKELMKKNYIRYASYVIRDRSIPKLFDGLKPVQRRILHTLFEIDDGKFHKVANVVGQTMAYHPHGDAAICDALVNLANKGYLLDTQGNFGNLYTGDPAAASRYIETRLSPLARETLFNPKLCEHIPSYDGRKQEPVQLPAKIPLLLMQGAEGIAVGMSTKILPHNFREVLEAQIAILEDRPFQILPDFQTGGIMDASEYQKGKGKIKLRAKIDLVGDKTLVIREICHGTSTESLIRSIDEAAKKGRLKIDSIHDYTAEKVEIEIKLPRGQYAKDLLDQLYAFTDCEVSIHSTPMVIDGNYPLESDVDSMLKAHLERLTFYLKTELEIEKSELEGKIFDKSLEQIFIEHRLYKEIEKVKKTQDLHPTVLKSLHPYIQALPREVNDEDIKKLLNIPIRRISRFDIDKNQEEIKNLEKQIKQIQKKLKNLKKTCIDYLQDLIDRYAGYYPRKTKIDEIEQIDLKRVDARQIKLGFDIENGYIGTKVTANTQIECSNYDKLLLLSEDGSYRVISVPEKLYVGHKEKRVIFAGIADKKTVFSLVYRDPGTDYCFAKRFVISQFILEKEYRCFEEGMKLEALSSHKHPYVDLNFKPKSKQKVKKMRFDLENVAIKGISAKGIRIAKKEVKKVSLNFYEELAKA